MTTTRPTGAVGIELDRETLLAAGRAQLEAQYPDRDPQKLTDGPLPQMLIPVNRGEVAIVNGEGVGCVADEHSIIDVYFGHEYDWIKIALTLDAGQQRGNRHDDRSRRRHPRLRLTARREPLQLVSKIRLPPVN